jgi:hypothetical protein
MMLNRSDTSIKDVVSYLAQFSIEAGYLVPTQNGLEKSILDAHESLRKFLAQKNLHDYSTQSQGPQNKVVKIGYLLKGTEWVETSISLYRPATKSGDPRIWISGLNQYAASWNLIVFIENGNSLYIFNASDPSIQQQFLSSNSFLSKFLKKVGQQTSLVENELLKLLKDISDQGFVPSTTNADSGVGDTLESLLGIQRNSNRAPDYKGIEIKTSRLNRRTGRQDNRSTLFSKIPNWEISNLKSAREILDQHGYVSNSTGKRALQVTLKNLPNAQGLFLVSNEKDSLIENLCQNKDLRERVVAWKTDDLENSLREKHRNTFWVKAQTREIRGNEFFHYVQVIATSSPLVSNFSQLVDLGSIQMDFTISEKVRPDGSIWVRDHGYLWKIAPEDIGLLFPPPRVIDLVAG